VAGVIDPPPERLGGWQSQVPLRAYDASRLAFELGRVSELRDRRGWSQSQLAHASGMTQSAVARFEDGGTNSADAVPAEPIDTGRRADTAPGGGGRYSSVERTNQ
jgi:hypothetical protein